MQRSRLGRHENQLLGGDAVARRNRRGRRRRNYTIGIAIALVAAAGATYAVFFAGNPAGLDPTALQLASNAPLATDRPLALGDNQHNRDVAERGADDPAVATAPPAAVDASRVRQLLAAGRDELNAGLWLAARQHLSEAYALGAPAEELTQLRADLTRIGDETIFSPRLYPDDPFVGRYIVQRGDSLGKIAAQYDITPQLLGRINDIKDVNRIQIGQTLKVIQGPFHAHVNKATYTMDVLLQGTFVRAYRVGLGADNGTPEGEWRVKVKLSNPTYYSPRGGGEIAADDPTNPLGERWIGLEGVGGAAVGQLRYGIHGTIEPESIGRSVSLGCIRMHNPDVEYFYDLVIQGKSAVTVD